MRLNAFIEMLVNIERQLSDGDPEVIAYDGDSEKYESVSRATYSNCNVIISTEDLDD